MSAAKVSELEMSIDEQQYNEKSVDESVHMVEEESQVAVDDATCFEDGNAGNEGMSTLSFLSDAVTSASSTGQFDNAVSDMSL